MPIGFPHSELNWIVPNLRKLSRRALTWLDLYIIYKTWRSLGPASAQNCGETQLILLIPSLAISSWWSGGDWWLERSHMYTAPPDLSSHNKQNTNLNISRYDNYPGRGPTITSYSVMNGVV